MVAGGARVHIGGPDGRTPVLQVHFPLEVVLPGPVVEGQDVLGEDGFRRTLGDPSHHEDAGAEVVRPDPGGVLAKPAVLGGNPRRGVRSGAAPASGGEQEASRQHAGGAGPQ